MSSLFPIRSAVESRGDGEPRLLQVDSDDAGPVLDALSSATARKVLAAVHEEPATKSELAERVDTSLQNASYHLEKLEEAGLVEVVDTWYSSRGREMPVFGATGGPVVVFAGGEEPTPDLRRALASALGALAVVGVLSAIVQWLFGQRSVGQSDTAFTGQDDTFSLGGGGDDVDVSADAAPEATEEAMGAADAGGDGAVQTTQEALRAAEATTGAAGDGGTGLLVGAGDWLSTLAPGALFFAGGLVVVLALVAWWYVRQHASPAV